MNIRSFPKSQAIGLAWTLVYAMLTATGPNAFRNSDIESVLVVFVLPIACLLAVFGFFRNGGRIAFGTLALSTLTLSIPFGPVHRMPDLPTLYSMLILLVGSPLALGRSVWRKYRVSGRGPALS